MNKIEIQVQYTAHSHNNTNIELIETNQLL